MVPDLVSKDMINQSDHSNTLNLPQKSLGAGERTFDYFGAIFYSKFIAGCQLNKFYDFTQEFKNCQLHTPGYNNQKQKSKFTIFYIIFIVQKRYSKFSF